MDYEGLGGLHVANARLKGVYPFGLEFLAYFMLSKEGKCQMLYPYKRVFVDFAIIPTLVLEASVIFNPDGYVAIY